MIDDSLAIQKRLAGDWESFRQLVEKYQGRAVGHALRKMKCPVLALNGETDLQVPSNENLREIEASLKAGGNKDVIVVRLPKLNHLFQASETGSPNECAKIEETIALSALPLSFFPFAI